MRGRQRTGGAGGGGDIQSVTAAIAPNLSADV